MMNPRAKIKCHPGSKKISMGRYPRSKKISKGRYPGSIKISKVLKRRIRNKKNIKVMDPRVKSQGSKKISKVIRDEPKIKKISK